jgi:hypothetical protein
MASPEELLSLVNVQLKQLLMVISDLFRPWKYSSMVRLKHSLEGWSCKIKKNRDTWEKVSGVNPSNHFLDFFCIRLDRLIVIVLFSYVRMLYGKNLKMKKTKVLTPTFYAQLLRQQSCASKVQTKNVSTKKLHVQLT